MSETLSLEWLEARSHRSDTGCLHWKQCCDKKSGIPVGWIDGRAVSLRRAIWKMTHGRQARIGDLATVTCGCDDCVEPSHIVMQTRSKALSGIPRSMVTRNRLAMTKRSLSKLSDEAVRQIRASDCSTAEAAQQHGISVEYVRKLRLNECRAELSSPFAGLGAR